MPTSVFHMFYQYRMTAQSTNKKSVMGDRKIID